MKRFFYLSGGLLCLALALLIGVHIGQRTAQADLGSGHVVDLDGTVALTEFGEAWHMRESGWERYTTWDPPVPVSQVKLWGSGGVITTSDEGWLFTGGIWYSLGPIPDGPTAAISTTWGNLKQKFVK